MSAVRPPAVAGMFYPGEPKQLRGMLDEMLAGTTAAAPARPPKLLIAPHAGYIYSGPTAAHAYALLAPFSARLTRVVLLGPSHRVAIRGLAISTATHFETPLGRVELDHDGLASVADLPQVVPSDTAHAMEHSLEVQLPFLQRVLERFRLVPFAVGEATSHEVAVVIERLWGGDETLIVISSDLSHYHPYAEAQRLDAATVHRIVALEPAINHAQACGATPINGALVAAARYGLRPRLLDLRNSGDTAGDRSRVVGYAAIAFETPDAVH